MVEGVTFNRYFNSLEIYSFSFDFRPNICIEREEIDEAKKNNSTSPATPTQRPATAETVDNVTLDEDELVAEDISKIGESDLKGSRQSRQFSAHVRMSSCNDEGLSYTCETK